MDATAAARHRARAAAVGRATAQLAAARGVTLPPTLRLWSLGGTVVGLATVNCGPGEAVAAPEAVGFGDPSDLARVLEAATDAGQRRANGLHVTPRWVADHLVERALAGHSVEPSASWTACDPACGGGAFLLAAARALHARGVARSDVVRDRLWGADIDPVGLAAAEAALAVWSGGEAPPAGRLVVADPLHPGTLWGDRPPEGFGLVVGNPPFQNQLGRATARSAASRRRLRARFGDAVRPYTDTAWLFLLLGCELARPGGRVVLLQPDSVVAARDAAAVRAGVDAVADLLDLWVDDRRVFEAAVRVCAPVLRVRAEPAPVGPAEARPVAPGAGASGATSAGAGRPPGAAAAEAGRVGAGRPPDRRAEELPFDAGRPAGRDAAGRWHDLLADASGIPPVALATSAGRLGDRAAVAAGFRDEYYGLAAVTREARRGAAGLLGPLATSGASAGSDDGPLGSVARIAAGEDLFGLGAGSVVAGEAGPASGEAPVVTAGAIDWGRSWWGIRPLRFAKRTWVAPVVDLARLEAEGTPAARRWVARTRGPKVVVATQTRVIEVAVDESGLWVPSVPVVAAVPHDPDDVWALAAALASPAATVWFLRRAPGTALAREAVKISARDLAALPLPVDGEAWRAATAAFRQVAQAPMPLDRGHLDAYIAAAAAAYDSAPSLVSWWRERLRPARTASGRRGTRRRGTPESTGPDGARSS